MKGAVATIDPKYQQVIEMIYFQGYTHKEASDELNIPLGTIKTRIKIALRELKKIYDFRLSTVLVNITLVISFLL